MCEKYSLSIAVGLFEKCYLAALGVQFEISQLISLILNFMIECSGKDSLINKRLHHSSQR